MSFYNNQQKVNVKRVELLEKLRANKENHVAKFKEAIVGYRKEVINYLEKLIDEVNNSKDISHTINVDKPFSYEKEYSRVIAMLEMSIDDTIELDSTTFNRYVLDEWEWKSNFETISAKYLSVKE